MTEILTQAVVTLVIRAVYKSEATCSIFSIVPKGKRSFASLVITHFLDKFLVNIYTQILKIHSVCFLYLVEKLSHLCSFIVGIMGKSEIFYI